MKCFVLYNIKNKNTNACFKRLLLSIFTRRLFSLLVIHESWVLTFLFLFSSLKLWNSKRKEFVQPVRALLVVGLLLLSLLFWSCSFSFITSFNAYFLISISFLLFISLFLFSHFLVFLVFLFSRSHFS